ncbi:hematopoietic stem cell homeostasis [Branchiostoma belcheri]|nr:hematopoietic stem cell homeostasis [Branchiostoma belcheri]
MSAVGTRGSRGGHRDRASSAKTQTQPGGKGAQGPQPERLPKQPQATSEQMRIAQMISDTSTEDPQWQEKIQQVRDVTGRGLDEATVALHDCDGDANRAINMLLEGEQDQGEWETAGKKKSRGAPSTQRGIDSGPPGKENREEYRRGRNRDDRDREGSSSRGRGPPRMSRGGGRGGSRPRENGMAEDKEGSRDRGGRGRGDRRNRGDRDGDRRPGRFVPRQWSGEHTTQGLRARTLGNSLENTVMSDKTPCMSNPGTNPSSRGTPLVPTGHMNGPSRPGRGGFGRPRHDGPKIGTFNPDEIKTEKTSDIWPNTESGTWNPDQIETQEDWGADGDWTGDVIPMLTPRPPLSVPCPEVPLLSESKVFTPSAPVANPEPIRSTPYQGERIDLAKLLNPNGGSAGAAETNGPQSYGPMGDNMSKLGRRRPRVYIRPASLNGVLLIVQPKISNTYRSDCFWVLLSVIFIRVLASAFERRGPDVVNFYPDAVILPRRCGAASRGSGDHEILRSAVNWRSRTGVQLAGDDVPRYISGYLHWSSLPSMTFAQQQNQAPDQQTRPNQLPPSLQQVIQPPSSAAPGNAQPPVQPPLSSVPAALSSVPQPLSSAQVGPRQAKPPRRKMPPPSKVGKSAIPESAVEMPGGSMYSVDSLDIQFGAMDFGSESTTSTALDFGFGTDGTSSLLGTSSLGVSTSGGSRLTATNTDTTYGSGFTGSGVNEQSLQSIMSTGATTTTQTTQPSVETPSPRSAYQSPHHTPQKDTSKGIQVTGPEPIPFPSSQMEGKAGPLVGSQRSQPSGMDALGSNKSEPSLSSLPPPPGVATSASQLSSHQAVSSGLSVGVVLVVAAHSTTTHSSGHHSYRDTSGSHTNSIQGSAISSTKLGSGLKDSSAYDSQLSSNQVASSFYTTLTTLLQSAFAGSHEPLDGGKSHHRRHEHLGTEQHGPVHGIRRPHVRPRALHDRLRHLNNRTVAQGSLGTTGKAPPNLPPALASCTTSISSGPAPPACFQLT